jgi:hypothetical protein
MGLLKAMHRRNWKSTVSGEFFKQHGVHLPSLADLIGPATLDDLLNEEYERVARSSPAIAVANLTRVLTRSFGINIPLVAMRSKIGALGRDKEAS